MDNNKLRLVAADKKGRIYDLAGFSATGMKAGLFFPLQRSQLIKLPYGSELLMLPERAPVGYQLMGKKFVALNKFFAVSAFVSPGYTITYNSAYSELNQAKLLPLFSYGAVAYYRGEFYAACVRVDKERRQDLKLMDINLVRRNVKKLKKLFPHNRLIRHLAGCALSYGCPAAKNFFLSRYEAPLPTAPYCNARCLGCISYQPKGSCSVTQPRIKFLPSAEEVTEIALYHLKNVKDPVVSFGQGCEGEPLLAGEVIEKAIKLIRAKTAKGMINLNTNASRPRTIERLFAAGLDSMRVSLNSARQDYYLRYYQPRDYRYQDVMASIKAAKKNNGFISLNYLSLPGFTDSEEEFQALKKIIAAHKIDMVQWRNLNFDPLKYFSRLRVKPQAAKLLGMKEIIYSLKKEFPDLLTGYFNPAKSRIARFRQRQDKPLHSS